MSDSTNTSTENNDAMATGTNDGAAAETKDNKTDQSTDGGKADKTEGADGDEGEKDTADLPEWARKQLTKANDEAAKYRTRAKSAAEETKREILETIRKALGGKDEGDKTPTVEDLAKELDSKAKSEKQARLELALYRQADKLGANVELLLDSRRFMEKLGSLEDTSDSKAVAEVVKTHLDEYPQYRAKKTPGGSSSIDTAGSGEKQITPEQFKNMTYIERVNLKKAQPALYASLANS